MTSGRQFWDSLLEGLGRVDTVQCVGLAFWGRRLGIHPAKKTECRNSL